MALNKNHEFEELDGVKCGIVEKNATPERVAFLKGLLQYNGYTVVAVPTPAPKVAATPKPAEPAPAEEPQPETENPKPETYTVGVTDYTFNWVNAIFGRQLKTKDGHFVTLAYWQQQDQVSNDEIPYYEHP